MKHFRLAVALTAAAFGTILGGCATTVASPWGYYHYQYPWGYWGYYDYHYSYGWPYYPYRYPYYPYRSYPYRYDARPMVAPAPPAVYDDRASAQSPRVPQAASRDQHAADASAKPAERRQSEVIGDAERTRGRPIRMASMPSG